MGEMSHRMFLAALGALFVLQALFGMYRMGEPMVDGRYHYNWGPAFWLEHAKATNDVGLNATYWGVKDYASHPQLIGPVVALWTNAFGYSERSIRTLPLLLTIVATGILALALRRLLDARRALLTAALFAALPLVYIYGKKLDQEVLVLVFLCTYLLGLSYIDASRRRGLALMGVSALGMMLSDWSGFVFAIVFAGTALYLWWKEDRSLAMRAACYTLLGAALGLFLYALQSYLQAGSPPVFAFMQSYADLWSYRATTGLNISQWILKQGTYLSRNYSLLLPLIALLGIAFSLTRRVRIEEPLLYRTALYMGATALANILYMLIVMQASSVHLYYQYFLALPIAFGIVLLIEKFLRPRSQESLYKWIAVAILLLFCTASMAGYQYHKLFTNEMAGDASDIELIKSIRELPQEATVVAGHINQTSASWYEGGNITWYAGRNIKGYVLEEGMPFTDFQIVPERYADAYLQKVAEGGYGFPASGQKVQCSSNLCLLSLERE